MKEVSKWKMERKKVDLRWEINVKREIKIVNTVNGKEKK